MTEVKKIVLADMRRLTIFFLSFSISMKASEMYHTTALQCHTALTYSIRTYECDIHTLKAGVKVALYYLLKRFAKVCTCIHLINDCDDKVADIWFFEVLEPNYHNLQVATFVTGIWSIQNPGLAFVHRTPWPGCVLTDCFQCTARWRTCKNCCQWMGGCRKQ